ncbi:hypothetical protein GOODEAATRI_026645 [Goodea atripinnis]|uniref:Uncharacterized protein n=1 Tax=Goodea atripinnis TaxID=208336 RepID=A0ABV0MKZ7_9TELE
MERVDGRNGEQVRPLRYHLNPQSDIPLTSSQKEVHDRPAPPTKPLPPDPTLTPLQQVTEHLACSVCVCASCWVSGAAAPTKPLPPDPPTPSNQVCVPLKPIVPKKPRPPAPPTQLYLPPQTGYVSNSKPAALGAVAPAASPSRYT